MRTISILLLMLISGNVFSQIQKKYYNWKWEESDVAAARFGSVIRQTDSGWLRQDIFINAKQLQMSGLYSDSLTKIKNGWFTYYYANGGISSTGKMINNKRDGLWLAYHQNGMLKDSAVYKNNYQTGTKLSWHSNGRLADSIVVLADNSANAIRWFDNGSVSETGIYSKNGKKNMQWKYYHQNGHPAAIEDYENGEMVKAVYYDETGSTYTDTAGKINVAAKFGNNENAWKKYSLKKIEFPEGVHIKNTTSVTIVASALIDEEGKLTEIFIDIPFHEKFDSIALALLKTAPGWKPAIAHGRRIKQGLSQPITFTDNR